MCEFTEPIKTQGNKKAPAQTTLVVNTDAYSKNSP
jgi:hypothetical protein